MATFSAQQLAKFAGTKRISQVCKAVNSSLGLPS